GALHGADWHDPDDFALACLIGQPGRTTSPLLLLVNPHGQDRPFALPPGTWRALLDTALDDGTPPSTGQSQGQHSVSAHSLALLIAA
ncbi:MAG: glycogen debranching enzyme GlgX, partial [Burkholderiales bacterium]|nr:glycogen debranching enzyme GlgX [Burkholderiales bacterium]